MASRSELPQTLWRAGIAFFEGDGRGLAGSLLLHALFALFVLLVLLRTTVTPPIAPSRFVPVDVIRLGEETISPPAPLRAAIPQPVTPHRAPHEPASANRPEGTSRTGTKPVDTLETKLRALAQLKQPESNIKPVDTPAANEAASSNDAASGAITAYAVRDLIRAQVERRWNFNVTALGSGSFEIALRVVVLRNGTVAKAEILDRERYTRDALYRDVALSARNAVLLSSPLTLPDGAFGDRIEVTLSLNPRDTLK
jgi:outer membrane biosynthesis protein TonB